MSAPDPDKLAEAAAKMRRPEIRMHPDAVQALGIANGAIGDADEEQLVEWSLPSGIAIVADESVEPGRMWLVDADPEPVPAFLAPPPIPQEMLDELARSYAHKIGMPERIIPRHVVGVDLGYGTDVTAIATVQDGRIVDVRYIRRPWKLTGRAATRARWRRRGRR